ncbi:MAG: HAMP domain-containing sensor histidine kinase [Candidatus Hydrogenedentota bacterium]
MELTPAQIESLIDDAQKGRNVNNVAHDVNNMLGAIMAYAELIRMDSTDPEVNRMIDKILGAVEKGADILSALTAISRRTVRSSSEVCEIATVMESLNLLFLYEFKLGLIQVQFVSDEGVDSAGINEQVLQRVLMHVLANALEVMADQEKKDLTIRASLEGDNVLITVKDFGDPIDHDVLERMFEPGFSTKDESHVGMGLSVARQLMTRGKGSIEYDPQAGFRILVPRAGWST